MLTLQKSVLSSACAQPGSLSLTWSGPSSETHVLDLIPVSIIATEETTQSTGRLLVTTGRNTLNLIFASMCGALVLMPTLTK